ncbi:restriction endonuclease subunit S [Bacteroides cellulosilyticus]|uniref:restriction endonuclease subunit S n=3 Tax=Bacteroides cellulosilyticus TaxID=246787 RepID=UPI001B8D4FC9|nr:restriction endonuclease subunit S [Bacteroides cellulosilyticus]QUT91049.1 Type I restriction modification DNA specificity domain protein [Bacteroides cellulosilyticus]
MDTKKLRQKILDLAIHGKLVPQDPNDEPASVLLERIKAEKERLIKEGKIKRSKKSGSSDTLHYENVPFEVPSSWVWCRLEDIVCELKYGTSEKSSSVGKIAVLRMGNITNVGTIDYSNLVYSSNDEDIEQYSLEKDDLLFNRTNSSEWVGKTAIYKEEQPAIYAGYLIRIRPLLISSDYLNTVMNSGYYRDWCYDVKTDAVNQSNINAQKLSQLMIPIPPLKEQGRIVAEMDKWISLIDIVKNGKDDLLTIIKQAKSKILNLAIRGKLVPQDPNDEPAIELLKRINPDFTPCDNEHYQNLPKGWCIVPMQMLCSLTDGEKQSGIERINLDVKYLRGERDAKMLSTGKYITENSLLILVDGENSGEVFQTPTEGYQGSTFKQLSINNNMNTDYMLQVINLHRKTLRENKVGSAIPHLNKKLFRAIEVPMPPYDEQHRIINVINVAYKHLDAIMENL